MELANKFNNYSATLDNIPFISNACIQIKRTRNSIFLEPANDDEVSAIFLSISNSSACNADGI